MGACCSSSGGGGGGGTTGVPASEGSAYEAAASGAPGAAGGGGAGPTEAERRPADATSSSAFPSRAISLAHLFSLLDAKTIDAAWTAHEVKVKHVLPVTLSTTTAYTDSPAGKDHSGETNLFVSHAWQYTFGSLVGALRNWATKTGADAATTYAWIDLFSVNQHVSQDVTQDEWAETFKNGIARAGRVVLVLTPWSNPTPYTRAWCLWEVFNASKTGARFEIALSSDEEQRLGDAVSDNSTDIVPALCEITSSKAEAQDPRDKEMIFSWITRPAAEGGAGGFRALDGLMLDLLREWLATVLAQLQEERSPAGAWEGDEEMIRFRGELANTYSELGRHAEALELRETVLGRRRALLGPEHPHTLSSMANLGISLLAVGRLDDALRLTGETIALQEKVLGPEHESTVRSQSQYATLLSSSDQVGAAAKALELHQAVLATRKKIGTDDESIFTSMSAVASCHHDLGNFDLAARLNEELRAAVEASLGTSHPVFSRALVNLAGSYESLGRLKEALAVQEEAIAAMRATLGASHPEFLLALGNQASILSDLGRADESLPLLEQVLETRQATLGPTHPDTLIALNNLASSLGDIPGREEEALAMTKESLETMAATMGAEHPHTLTTRGNLALFYRQLGRHDEALPLFKAVLASRQKVFGPSHPETLDSLGHLAAAYDDAEPPRREEALALRQEGLAGRRQGLGNAHPDTIQAMLSVASTFGVMDRYAEAVTLQEEALLLQYESLGVEDVETQESMAGLALFYSCAGRHQESADVDVELLRLRQQRLGAGHELSVQTANNLSLTYRELDREADALEIEAEIRRNGGAVLIDELEEEG